ncbi:MAG TPA: glycosyltransferase [Gaiellaceae bacterium]|nr:glycosyltransferase [Gaiellaceae bacterium]
MTPPLVSVIVTAYNVGRFVERALESALAQDYPSIEVVVVDDGSTDDTPEVLARFADRVTVVTQANGGVQRATSAGLARVRGDYIAFLDGDDTWPSDRIRRMVELLEARPEVGLVHGDMAVIDEHDRIVHPSFFESSRIVRHAGDVYGILVHANFASGGASMVRGSLKSRFAPIPDSFPWQDWWVSLRVAEVAEVAQIDGILNNYRRHDANFGFGVTGERQVRSIGCEVACRRHILRHLHDSRAPIVNLASSHGALELQAGQIAALTGSTPAEAVEVTGDDRAAADAAHAAGGAAVRSGELERGGRLFLQALGHDPFHRARADLHYAIRTLEAAGELDRSGAPLPPPELASEGLVAVALLDELQEEPALLGRFYAEQEPAATLRIVSRLDETATGDRLVAVARAAGVGDGDGPDLVAVPVASDTDGARVAAAATVRLGAARIPGAGRLARLAA